MGLHGFDRRTVLKGAAAAALVPLLPGRAMAAGSHGLSVFGDLKYDPDFTHFAYADVNAPKGGRLALVPWSWAFNQNPVTFNTLNTLILKGDAPVGLEIIYDTLMARAWDEPDAVYGLVAETVEISEDGNTYRFNIRPEAHWHDGTALTAGDIAFSLNTLKEKGHPLISQAIREMSGATAENGQAVVTFTGKQARSLPITVSSLPIVSQAYYEKHDFTRSNLDVPLGSGPYRIGEFEPGKYINYERVEDYWGRDLPVRKGQFNFDTLRYDFYRDQDVSFEAFKAGEYMLREEFSSRIWATGYDFPAINDGRVVKLELPDDTPSGTQGWFINTRRTKFADPRVREALIYAFDFEWTNRTLFYELYQRTHSYFQNSDMAAIDAPSADELALLEPWRGKVPDEVFGEPFVPPVSNGSGQDRKLRRRAARLLKDAGMVIKAGKMYLPSGEPFEIEFLDNDGSLGRIVQPYIKNLKRLGIEATFRIIDPAQYQNRINEFDYDLIVRRFAMSPTPSEGIRQFWGSASAGISGSNNLSGIKDAAVDALTTLVITAQTRPEQVTAARALDRVLRSGRYWLPHWFKAKHTLAVWDAFGRPPKKPRYRRGVIETWWFDAEKAEKIGMAG